MPFETSAARIWKRLGREERLAAATDFWQEPPEIMVGTALAAIAKARHMRPQAARALSQEARAQAMAMILDPGETLASSLVVSLHLGERRPMLVTFLDAVGLAHEDGLLKDDDASGATISEDAARQGVRALAAAFPRAHVETYLNTLWLQEPERWAVLTRAADWLPAATR